MPDVQPRRQRVSAYAVITRDRELLLTRMAPQVRIAGSWTLPGGGLDHGEDPRDALRREVYEETGLHAQPGRVLDVHSVHFTGAAPSGLVEDYHGIHLIFAAQLLPASLGVEPYVVDAGGSTDLARWVPLDEVPTLRLLSAAAHALTLLREEC